MRGRQPDGVRGQPDQPGDIRISRATSAVRTSVVPDSRSWASAMWLLPRVLVEGRGDHEVLVAPDRRVPGLALEPVG